MPIASERQERTVDRLEAVMQMSERMAGSGLDPSLIQLMKAHAAILKGCRAASEGQASAAGEARNENSRVRMIGRWRDADSYSPGERAVLGWAEAVYRGDGAQAIDAALREASRHYTPDELLLIAMALLAIQQIPCADLSPETGLPDASRLVPGPSRNMA